MKDIPSGRFWWMTANSDYWDLPTLAVGGVHQYTKYNENGNQRWRGYAFDEIKKGDWIVGYVTGKGSRLHAVCALLQCTHALTKKRFKGEDIGEHIQFKKIRNLNPVIPREVFKTHSILRNAQMVRCRFQGSLLGFNTEETAALIDLLKQWPERQYWTYTPGSNARGSWDFESDIRDGVMGLGQDELGDLRKYGTGIKKLARDMRKHYDVKGDGSGNARYMLRFRDEMKVGDVVFVKRGKHVLAGVGIVTGDYRFDRHRKARRQVRSVRWIWNGERASPCVMPITTLTCLSDPKKIGKMLSAAGISERDLVDNKKLPALESTVPQTKRTLPEKAQVRTPLSPRQCAARLKRITRTEKLRQTLQRFGQRELREFLLGKRGQCAVTGLRVQSMLVVSHIKDWTRCNRDERLDEENVLLLARNYDAAFDAKLIGFDSSGNLMKSESVSWEDLAALGIKKSAKISHPRGRRAEYLAWHRARLV